MAELVPLKAVYDGSSICGLSELRDGDVVGVEHGGLGVCTIPSNTLLIGNGQGAISTTSALTTNGQIIIGGTGGPQIANLTGTSNEVEITDGNGAITIGLPATVQIATNLKTPAFSITNEYCLPTSDGSAGQIMCTNGSGALAFVDFDGTGHCIAFSGTTVADRTCLNFLGGGVTVSDNSGTNATDITIPVTTPELKVRNTAGCELSIELENTAIGGELVCDTTPQLGGTLDVNGYGITSISNGNISITPNGSGSLVLDGLSWPQADGTAGYILCTDGSGSLSWATDASGQSVAGSNTQLQFNNSGNFGASSNLTFDGSTLAVAGNASAYVVSLDSITSRTGTSVGVTLGDDADDDFAVDGTKLVVEGDTGRVGIGTAAPTDPLTLSYTAADYETGLVIHNTNTAGYGATIRFETEYGGGTDKHAALSATAAGSGGALDFFTGSDATTLNHAMRINQAGHIGIGTYAPDHIFHVRDVGANSFNTKFVLDLENTRRSGWTEAAIELASEYGTPGNGTFRTSAIAAQLVGDQSTTDIVFYSESTERMRIGGNGKVGIGTLHPDGNLHVMSASAGTVTADSNADEFVIEGSANTGMTILSGSSQAGVIVFGDAANNNLGQFGYHQGNEEMFWGRDDAQQMVLDSNGKLGIGNNTPSTYSDTSGSSLVVGTSNANDGISIISSSKGRLNFGNGSGDPGEWQGIIEYVHSSNTYQFFAANYYVVGINTASAGLEVTRDSTSLAVFAFKDTRSDGASGSTLGNFVRNGSTVGSVSTTTSSTSFNTSSDYRLKENVVDLTNATNRVAQLQPHRFNFIIDPDATVDGFIAHEVNDIVPEAITGTKDETRDAENVIVDSAGKILEEGKTEAEWTSGKEDETYDANTVWHETLTVPEYQGIDQAKLVPLLTAAIQELTARVAELESA